MGLLVILLVCKFTITNAGNTVSGQLIANKFTYLNIFR